MMGITFKIRLQKIDLVFPAVSLAYSDEGSYSVMSSPMERSMGQGSEVVLLSYAPEELRTSVQWETIEVCY